nr:hypothetical protein [Streptomyces sp. MJM1172]
MLAYVAACGGDDRTDAVRRATQKRLTGKEAELGEDAERMAPGWSADQLRGAWAKTSWPS